MSAPSNLTTTQPAGLLEVLDRVLDKGLVVVGDIKVSLLDIELLTLQIRLLVCSIDKAEEIGIDWWRFSPDINPRLREQERAELHERETPVRETRRSKSKGVLPGT